MRSEKERERAAVNDPKARCTLRCVCSSFWPSYRSDPTLRTPGWNLQEGYGDRRFERVFRFPEGAFDSAPMVFCALSAIDLLSSSDYCVSVTPQEITDKSMRLCFATRFHSSVYSACASWFAFSLTTAAEDRERLGTAQPLLLRTGRVRFTSFVHGGSPSQPGAVSSSTVNIALEHGAYDLNDCVMIAAISGLNVSNSAPLSINLRVRRNNTFGSGPGFAIDCNVMTGSYVRNVEASWLVASRSLLGTSRSECFIKTGFVQLGPRDLGDTFTDYGAPVGPRKHEQPVVYPIRGPADRFATVPEVITCISGLEVPNSCDVRLKAIETNRAKDRFTLGVGTWADTRVSHTDVVWLAAAPRTANVPLRSARPVEHFGVWSDQEDSDEDNEEEGVRHHRKEHGEEDDDQDTEDDDQDTEDDDQDTDDYDQDTEDDDQDTEDDDQDTEGDDQDIAEDEDQEEDDDQEPEEGDHQDPERDEFQDIKDERYAEEDEEAGEPPAKKQCTEKPAAEEAKEPAAAGGGGPTEGECKVCFEGVIDTVILPCGHRCVCRACCKNLTGENAFCPICRTKIIKVVRTYTA